MTRTHHAEPSSRRSACRQSSLRRQDFPPQDRNPTEVANGSRTVASALLSRQVASRTAGVPTNPGELPPDVVWRAGAPGSVHESRWRETAGSRTGLAGPIRDQNRVWAGFATGGDDEAETGVKGVTRCK